MMMKQLHAISTLSKFTMSKETGYCFLGSIKRDRVRLQLTEAYSNYEEPDVDGKLVTIGVGQEL